MPGPVSRVTLPSEFFDITSAMMLVQPEPQYLYARLAFMSRAAAELAASEGANLGGSRAAVGQGAAPLDLETQMLTLANAPQAAAINGIGELERAGIGHTVRMNRPLFTDSTYTEASRKVIASASISTTPIDLAAEQVSITVYRVAGPYDNGNTRVAPYAVDRLDAQRSVHSLAGTVGLHLQRDRMKYVDFVFRTRFDSGSSRVRPGGAATDAAAFVANGDRPMDLDTLYRAEQALLEANIPRFANGVYMTILSPQQMRQLRSDPDFNRQAIFKDGDLNPLASSFIGRVGQVELYVSNTYVTDTATVSGVTIHHGAMFGPGAVGYGVAEACHVSYSNDDNYGETAKVVWLAYEGHELLDNRFIVNINTD